jgi:soluble lytic murein transglycosylase
MKILSRRFAVLLAVLVPLFAGAAPAPGPRDIDFIAAREAAKAGDKARLAIHAATLKGHVLEAYVEWWALRLRLEETDPAVIRAFLDRHAGTVIGDTARVEWLKLLGRRQDWPTFGQEIGRAAPGDDTDLACLAIQYRRATVAEEAVLEARRLWFSGQEAPASCAPLFDALFARGDLGSADVWARFRLAHEAGRYALAKSLNDRLPPAQRIPAKTLDQIAVSPLKVLAASGSRTGGRAGPEAALYALQRAVKDSPAAARDAWVKVRDRLPREDRLYGNGQLAYGAARRHLPEALAWYREADGAPMSDLQLAWRARAALRAGAWSDVVAAVDAMSAAGRQEATWRYWRSRALRETGRTGDADPVLTDLAREPNFYGLLAAEELGVGVKLASDPVAAGDAALRDFGARPVVQRVLKLYELEMRPEALQEWIYAIRGASDPDLLVAAEFAAKSGIYDRAINTAERTRARHDFSLRYLAPYRDVLSAAAKTYGLEEALVLGLVRQESRFIVDIVSSAGAVGLMQLMPATARWIAKKLGRSDFRTAQIALPEINAEFGSYYLRHVLDRFDGLPVLATAAYNAGPGRAQAWRAGTPLEGAIYAETIPFNETRDYVKKVLANAVLYSHQLGLPQVALKDRLGVIPARGGETVAAASAAQ